MQFRVHWLHGRSRQDFCLQKSRMPLAGLVYLLIFTYLILPGNLMHCLLRPPQGTGVCEPRLHKAYTPVLLERFHHKPMVKGQPLIIWGHGLGIRELIFFHPKSRWAHFNVKLHFFSIWTTTQMINGRPLIHHHALP